MEDAVYAYGYVNNTNASTSAKGLTISAYSGITYNGSSTFTVTAKGLYLIHVQQLMQTTGAVYLQININGSTVRHAYHDGYATRDLVVDEMRVLNVGDTVSVGQSGTSNTTWGLQHSMFHLHLIQRMA